MLERKWPDKYTGGHAHWTGRLYARGLLPGLGRWRVYYGTWGTELFQSLYAPRGGVYSSLLVAFEWYLWIAALALLSIAGLAWTPLLFAAPALALALGATLVAAGMSAARSQSVLRPPRRAVRATRWALTTFLHLIQPLARIRGRLGHAKSAHARTQRFAVPLPRVSREWTEAWQSGGGRLSEIKRRLRSEGTLVARGGAYDRWDLQARRGLLGSVLLRLAIEEHGAGRQLVRVQLTPRYSRTAVSLFLVLLSLSLLALADGPQTGALVLLVAALALGARAVRSAGLAMGSVLGHIRVSQNPRFSRRMRAARAPSDA